MVKLSEKLSDIADTNPDKYYSNRRGFFLRGFLRGVLDENPGFLWFIMTNPRKLSRSKYMVSLELADIIKKIKMG